MSTEAVTTTTASSDRQGRFVTKQDRRRGRSRSPSAYLRKKGNGLMRIISAEKIRKGIKKSKSATSLLLLSGKSSNKAIDNREENKTTDKSSSNSNKPSEEEITESDSNTDKVETTLDTAAEKLSETKIDQDGHVPTKPYEEEITDSDSNSDKVETSLDTVAEKLSETKIDQNGHVSTKRDAEGSLRNPQDDVPSPKRSHSNDHLFDDNGKETVQFILLLVELQMEQIELLQFGFDPNKALIHDILAQIPKSATFDGIKNQLYEGICSVDGEEMSDDMLLKDFVKAENEVKLAIPGGMTGIEFAKIAAPILTDEKVGELLQRLGTSHVSFDSILPFKEADDESSTFAIEVIEPITEDKRAEEKAVMPDDNHSPSKETDDAEAESEIKESVNGRSTVNINISEEPARKNLSVEKIKEIVSSGVKVVSGKVRAINIEKLTSQSKPVGIGVALLLLSLVMIIIATTLSTTTMPWSSESTMKAGQIPRKCGIVDFFKSTKHCDGMSAKFRRKGILGVH